MENRDDFFINAPIIRRILLFFLSILVFFLIWTFFTSFLRIIPTRLFNGNFWIGYSISVVIIGVVVYLLGRKGDFGILVKAIIFYCFLFFVLQMVISLFWSDSRPIRNYPKELVGNYLMLDDEEIYEYDDDSWTEVTAMIYVDTRYENEGRKYKIGEEIFVFSKFDDGTYYLSDQREGDDNIFLENREWCFFPEYAHLEYYSPLLGTELEVSSWESEIAIGLFYSLELILTHLLDSILFTLFCIAPLGKTILR